MELKTCQYCGTEYKGELSQCPLCGMPYDLAAETAEELSAAGKGGARLVSRNAKNGKMPRWMWLTACGILAVAVVIGAVYFLYAMGLFSSEEDKTIHEPAEDSTIVQQDPVEDEPVPGEDEPVQVDPTACTDLILSQTAVTLDEKSGYFFLTVLAEPSDCKDPITYASSDPAVAEVSGHGSSCMITAVSPGVAEIIVTCGDVEKTCVITCDFEELPPEDTETETEAQTGTETEAEPEPEPEIEPTLSSVDFTLFTPGEQTTLLVNDAPVGATITFTSSNTNVCTVTNKGLITAVGSGSCTITVKVNDTTLQCIARCNLKSSAETGSGSTEPVVTVDPNAVFTISHSDVTLNPNSKTFQITLKDESGKAVSGESWTSTDAGVCTVDANGNVTAVGSGKAEVKTTYGEKTYSCIVRCHMG